MSHFTIFHPGELFCLCRLHNSSLLEHQGGKGVALALVPGCVLCR